ncbi:hypothetical protein EQ500_15560 [Lactobacillus sp. XV13L]|nr:hypothetical protein [Lactobacillus sp. XV13L]
MTKEGLPVPTIGTEVVLNPVKMNTADIPHAKELIAAKHIYGLTWNEQSLWLKAKNGKYQMANHDFIQQLSNTTVANRNSQGLEEYEPAQASQLSIDNKITKQINQIIAK